MPTLVIAVNVSGNADELDKRAMTLAITNENVERAKELGQPRPQLPLSTNAELKASYQTILQQLEANRHASLILQSDVATLREIKVLWDPATDAKRNAARAALQ